MVPGWRAELLVDFVIIEEAGLVTVVAGIPVAQIWIRAAGSSASEAVKAGSR